MTHARAPAEPCADPNNVATQLATFFDNLLVLNLMARNVSYPSFKRGELKLPYVCPGCSNHMYDQ
jgi:hypothetical protein